MARKLFSGKNKSISVLHPNDPEISGRFTKLKRADAMEFFQSVRDSRPARVIRDGEQILRDELGKPVVYTGGNDFPLDAVLKFLKRTYVPGSMVGLLDENNNPLEVVENVEALLDEELDVVGEDGESYPFWQEIFRRVSDRAEFTSDPNSQR